MISSCSRWIVATMSPIWPVLACPSAASRAPGPPRARPFSTSPSFVARSTWAWSGPSTVGLGEVLVFDPEHLSVADLEVASAREPERLDAGRSVERLGDRRAPVDDERLEVLAGHRDAPDVERLAASRPGRRCGVDAAEAQRLVADVELLEPQQRGVDDDVALGARLQRAAPADVEDIAEHRARVVAHGVERGVRTVEVVLLFGDLTLVGHAAPSAQCENRRVYGTARHLLVGTGDGIDAPCRAAPSGARAGQRAGRQPVRYTKP